MDSVIPYHLFVDNTQLYTSVNPNTAASKFHSDIFRYSIQRGLILAVKVLHGVHFSLYGALLCEPICEPQELTWF